MRRFPSSKILFLALIVVVAFVGIFSSGIIPQEEPKSLPQEKSVKPCKLPLQSRERLAEKVVLDFDQDRVGVVPDSLQVGKTGRGTQSQWSVKIDATAPSPRNVLAQTAAEDVNFHFPYVILGGESFDDVNITVDFKAISGGIDQAAGIVFRFFDSSNYYVLRANALENNLILFKFVDGARFTITSASIPVSSGEWHSLRVIVIGECVRGYLDDDLLIEIEDSTFKEGSVGLWTKADSVTYFDNFMVEY